MDIGAPLWRLLQSKLIETRMSRRNWFIRMIILLLASKKPFSWLRVTQHPSKSAVSLIRQSIASPQSYDADQRSLYHGTSSSLYFLQERNVNLPGSFPYSPEDRSEVSIGRVQSIRRYFSAYTTIHESPSSVTSKRFSVLKLIQSPRDAIDSGIGFVNSKFGRMTGNKRKRLGMSNEEISELESSYILNNKLAINSSIVVNPVVVCGYQAMQYMITRMRYPQTPITRSSLFKDYIKRSVRERMKNDHAFVTQVEVREIRRKHAAALNLLESDLMTAKSMLFSHQSFPELSLLEKDIIGGKQAITSMSKLLDNFDKGSMTIASNITETSTRKFTEERINRIKTELLPKKVQEINKKIQKRDKLKSSIPQIQSYQKSMQKLDEFYTTIGLMNAIESQQSTENVSGVKRQNNGKGFEETAFPVIERKLIPRLALLYGLQQSDIFIVRNVKFGIATSRGSTGELDCLVCTRIPTPARFVNVKPKSSFCKVLAVVEIKRNPDDIGEAFVSYQKSLAWLSGSTSTYSPNDWKTKTHPSGHFAEKPFTIVCGDEVIGFSTESFSHLKTRDILLDGISDLESLRSRNVGVCAEVDVNNDSHDLVPTASSSKSMYNLFVDDLYFVSKPSYLDGMTSKISSWLLRKISSSLLFDMELNNDEALETLRLSTIDKYPLRLSTIELLEMYNEYNIFDQLYLVGKEEKNASKVPKDISENSS